MVFELTHEDKILTLVDATPLERKQLKLSLTRKLEYYNFLPPAVKAKWDGIISYFHKDRFVPAGLWKELKDICDTFGYKLHIKGIERMFYRDVTFEQFKEWVDNKFKDAVNDKGQPFVPRDYQVETAYKALTNKCSMSELATSAGKSLIMFICIAYFQEHQIGRKFLMIVPSISLVIQAYEDFHEYNSFLTKENKIELNIKQIHGGEKKDFSAKQNIHISTFQSLVNFEDSYFLPWDTIIVDEAHRTKSISIRDILGKCTNAQRKIGLTGTVPKQGTLDSLTLQAYLGPKVMDIKAKELQDEGHIADIKIGIIELEYPTEVKDRFEIIRKGIGKEDRGKLLKLEQDFVIEHQSRMEVIGKIINKLEKNQLVLFHRTVYGKKLRQYLEENTDKEVYFIYGQIGPEQREEILSEMKKGSNKILVASYGTLSTGINVSNFHNIHFTESFKSDVIIRQSIGRGLRLHEDKDALKLFDYVDVLTHKKVNMLYYHSKTRRNIYKEQGFTFSIKNITLPY